MAEGTDDFVGGVLLAWAFVHLVACTLDGADWMRVRAAWRGVVLRGTLTCVALLQLTAGSDFFDEIVRGSWVVGAGCLLLVPVAIGCVAERYLGLRPTL